MEYLMLPNGSQVPIDNDKPLPLTPPHHNGNGNDKPIPLTPPHHNGNGNDKPMPLVPAKTDIRDILIISSSTVFILLLLLLFIGLMFFRDK